MFSAVVESKMGIPNNGFHYSEDCINSVQSKDLDIAKTRSSVSNDEINFSKTRKLPQVFASLAASLGAFVMGTTLGWSSPVGPQILLTNQTANMAENITDIWFLQLTDEEMSWVGSLLNIGGLLGSLSGGFLMNTFGAKTVMMSLSVPFVIGWLIIAFATNTPMLFIGRIICGIADGICTAVIPSYIGDISTPNLRGTLGILFTLNLVSGVLLTSILAWLPWRWITGILIIPPLMFLIAVYFVPESPYFLITHGRIIDANCSLQWLRGSNNDIASEISQLQTRIRVQSENTVKISDLIQPWAYKPIFIGFIKMVIQQLAGLNVAQFYSITIFKESGSSLDPKVSSIILNVVQVLATAFSSMVLVERLGRRTLSIMSEFLAALSLFVLGGYLYILKDNSELGHFLSWLPVLCLVFYIAVVDMGLSPLAWVVSNEVLPDKLKGPGSSLAAFFNWLASFVITKTFVDLQRTITDAGAFWFYGSCCILGILFDIFIIPETKGKTCQEIEALFR